MYKKNRAAVAGLVILIVLVLIAIFDGYIAPLDPNSMGSQRLSTPSLANPFGTDDLGRDVFSGVIHGARVSLIVGLLGALTTTAIAIFVGALSGYLGGHIDDLMMRVTEVFMVIPRLFLALVIAAIWGSSIWNIILVIGVLSWPGCARLVRAEFMSLKQQEFVEAAKAQGASRLSIIFSEILPNAMPPIIISASLAVGSAILLESSLSFLGLGDPNVLSWGVILHNCFDFFYRAWWTALFPGLALFITVLAVNMVGDGLNDALNPKLRER